MANTSKLVARAVVENSPFCPLLSVPIPASGRAGEGRKRSGPAPREAPRVLHCPTGVPALWPHRRCAREREGSVGSGHGSSEHFRRASAQAQQRRLAEKFRGRCSRVLEEACHAMHARTRSGSASSSTSGPILTNRASSACTWVVLAYGRRCAANAISTRRSSAGSRHELLSGFLLTAPGDASPRRGVAHRIHRPLSVGYIDRRRVRGLP
jgi:hypothetical protein